MLSQTAFLKAASNGKLHCFSECYVVAISCFRSTVVHFSLRHFCTTDAKKIPQISGIVPAMFLLVEELIIFSEPLNDTSSHLLTMEIYVYVTNQYKSLAFVLEKILD